MTVSLLNVMVADQVNALLDAAHPHEEAAMSREQAAMIIHAVLWLMACRQGSFGSAYAYSAFASAVGRRDAQFIIGTLDFDWMCRFDAALREPRP